MMIPSLRFVRAASVACLVTAGACVDATDVELLRVDADGSLFGRVYLDTDGDGTRDATDAPVPGVRVVLATGRGASVSEATTDTAGAFVMNDVPVGSYTLGLTPGALGDSLQTTQAGGAPVTIQRGDSTQVDLGVSFPILTVEEIADFPVGRRIFTSGIALNARLPFGDGRLHVAGASSAIRAVNVARLSLNAGDSVRLSGRTGRSAGRPVLEDAEAVVLVAQAAIPVPEEVGTSAAATAEGGDLDAALVRVRDAAISDTTTVDGDFRFTVDDGSGPLGVRLPSFLQLSTEDIRPDTIIRVSRLTGLLVPYIATSGETVWELVPRGGSDLTLQVRQVDLSVTVTADRPTASRADTVTFTVATRNAGPLSATAVQVRDSLPDGFTFLDATTTRGTFSSGTGVWTLGDAAAGAADTLTVRATVTTTLLGTFIHRARLLPLTLEVDSNPLNNQASVAVQVVAPPP